jgi:hypothetical protein
MLNFMGKILEVRLTGKLKYATTSSWNNWPTPYCMVFLEKLIVTELIKK